MPLKLEWLVGVFVAWLICPCCVGVFAACVAWATATAAAPMESAISALVTRVILITCFSLVGTLVLPRARTLGRAERHRRVPCGNVVTDRAFPECGVYESSTSRHHR